MRKNTTYDTLIGKYCKFLTREQGSNRGKVRMGLFVSVSDDRSSLIVDEDGITFEVSLDSVIAIRPFS